MSTLLVTPPLAPNLDGGDQIIPVSRYLPKWRPVVIGPCVRMGRRRLYVNKTYENDGSVRGHGRR